jgi:DNA helicase IV
VAPAILEVADKIMAGKFNHKPMLDTHQYKGDPGTVDVVSGIDFAEQIKTAIPKIAKQLAVYPGQLVGVLVPLRNDVEGVVNQLLSAPDLTGKVSNAMATAFDPALPIWVSTVHSAKGLEFRCVHVMAAETMAKFQEHERRVTFTAVTRAKTSLTVYHHEPLHAFFAAALAKPSAQKVTVKKLFGKTT